MSRRTEPIFFQEGNYYARWWEGTGKNRRRIVKSLGTKDKAEACEHLPLVLNSKMSWEEYRNTTAEFIERPITQVKSVSGINLTKFDPPITFESSKDKVIDLLKEAMEKGRAEYDPTTCKWTISLEENTDESQKQDTITSLSEIKKTFTGKNDEALQNNDGQIKTFYRSIIIQRYKDKKTAERFSRIWLNFLQENKIISWSQFNEELLIKFREWRKLTRTPTLPGKSGVLPSIEVVNRHLKFLSASFDLAVQRKYIPFNPIAGWAWETHQPPVQECLTREELIKVLSDKRWKRDFMVDAIDRSQAKLGYRLLDPVLLLFASNKRRGEILGLKIGDINYTGHYVSYTETKNTSKRAYNVHKAFWLTPEMETLLRRITKSREKRKDEFIFARLHNNPNYLTNKFDEIAKGAVSEKPNIHLHNLRHTATDILDSAGLTDGEQDDTLGHYSVNTALKNYRNFSKEAAAKRLAARTRKGIEFLSAVVKKLM
jgi:integrase